MPRRLLMLLAGLSFLTACGEKIDPVRPQNILDAEALLLELRADDFESWTIVPGWDPPQMSSPGDHSGRAVVFMNPTLEVASGSSGLMEWPVDSISVKSILDETDDTSIYLAIAQKRSDGWFYAGIDPRTDAINVATAGAPCASCHLELPDADDGLFSLSLP